MTREEILQIARPILFNTDMVRAILEGRKSVTRRVMETQPPQGAHIGFRDGVWEWFYWVDGERRPVRAPYKVDDYLYVRETWFYEMHMEELTAGKPELPSGRYSHRYVFRASIPSYPVDIGVGGNGWKPSIHMPKEAARIFLKVTDVRVERLQDMTLDDFLSEGVVLRPETFNDPENAYRQARNIFSGVWDSTISKKDLKKYGWDASPWVWVIQFKRVEV